MDNSVEEVFYLDTNNLPTSNSSTNAELPFVYLQGYSKTFDLLRTVFDTQESNPKAIDLLSTFEDALHVSEIIKAARDSSLTKAWVQVNKDN